MDVVVVGPAGIPGPGIVHIGTKQTIVSTKQVLKSFKSSLNGIPCMFAIFSQDNEIGGE